MNKSNINYLHIFKKSVLDINQVYQVLLQNWNNYNDSLTLKFVKDMACFSIQIGNYYGIATQVGLKRKLFLEYNNGSLTSK